MFVDFAQLHREGSELRERYIATVDVITAVLWPAFAGAAVLSGPLILAIYGEHWLAAATPMAILALSSMVLVSITMTWEVFTATGNLATQTRIEFVNALFSLAAFAIGSCISLTAAAAGRVVAALASVILYRPHLNRMTGTTTSDFVPVYLKKRPPNSYRDCPGRDGHGDIPLFTSRADHSRSRIGRIRLRSMVRRHRRNGTQATRSGAAGSAEFTSASRAYKP